MGMTQQQLWAKGLEAGGTGCKVGVSFQTLQSAEERQNICGPYINVLIIFWFLLLQLDKM